MSKLLQIIIEIAIIFTMIFLLNYFLFIRKNKKLNKDEMPLELIYLSGIYGIDVKKINFRRFQYIYSLINSFIITTTYMLVIYLINGMILRIILGIIIMVLLIIICYGLLAKYYLYKEEKNNTKKDK